MANIVLIGDYQGLAKSYQFALERGDEHQVLTSASLEDALKLLGDAETLPEMIVSGVEVDEAAGLDFVKSLKGDERMADISVLMISNIYSDSYAKDLHELGAGLMSRIDSLDELRTAVDYELSAKSGILSMLG